MLREVGFLLKRIVATENATVARYGGDEFVRSFPIRRSTSEWNCARRSALDRSHTFLEREWGLGNPPLRLSGVISASIGVAQHLPVRDSNVALEQEKSDLLRRADAAMYRANRRAKIRSSSAAPPEARRVLSPQLTQEVARIGQDHGGIHLD